MEIFLCSRWTVTSVCHKWCDASQPIWWINLFSRDISVHSVYQCKESQRISLMPKDKIYYSRQHLKNLNVSSKCLHASYIISLFASKRPWEDCDTLCNRNCVTNVWWQIFFTDQSSPLFWQYWAEEKRRHAHKYDGSSCEKKILRKRTIHLQLDESTDILNETVLVAFV
jgi:hypothetical protein